MKRGTQTVASLLALATCVQCFAGGPRFHKVATWNLGGDGGWDYLFFDNGGKRLYISRGTHVMVVNGDTGSIAGDIPNTPGVHGIAIAPKHHLGFTSNGRDDSVTVFDTRTLQTVSKVKVGQHPDAIIYDPGSDRVFTFNAGTSDATAVDAGTLKVAGSVPIGGRPEFAAADGQGKVYCNVEDKNQILEIDSKNLQPLRRFDIGPGDGPSGLAIDAKRGRLFSVCGNNQMVVVDTQSGTVLARPAIGNGPDAAVFDAGLGIAFSSNGQSGNLTLVSETSPGKFEVVDTVETVRSARTLALDSKTHRIFLASAKFQAPAAGERRGRTVPGSFAIIVVSR